MPFLKIEKLETEYAMYIILLENGFYFMESGLYIVHGCGCKASCTWCF
jgi:hypothetical protein